ncbi:MAG: hypothetical protein M1835_005636 [Candelina submexicana]|nr:MAG: hypothetical protein M1835_005636 [Candelina submexicana]
MASPDSQADQAQRTAEARAAVVASLNSVGSGLDADLRDRAANLHSNSAALAKQEADLAKQTAAFSKQSAQWQKMADNSREKLKEIGDIQNWAELIERDLLVVEETLRIAEGGDQEMNGRGSHDFHSEGNRVNGSK